MSVATLVRTDVRNASRSRMVWGLTAAFTAFAVLGVSLARLLGVADAAALEAVGTLSLPSILLVPLAAIVVGYVAVVGELQSGRLELVLGFPVSKGSIVAGKALSRSAVVSGSITVGFLAAGIVAFGTYGGFSLARYAAFALATVALGVAFTGLAVGASAAVRSRGEALACAVGAYLALVLFWQLLVAGLYYAATGSLPGSTVPAWYLFVERLSPPTAYQVLVEAALEVPASASIFSVRPPGASSAPVSEQIGSQTVPAYLSAPVSALVLCLWAIVPTLLGYWRFRRRDL